MLPAESRDVSFFHIRQLWHWKVQLLAQYPRIRKYEIRARASKWNPTRLAHRTRECTVREAVVGEQGGRCQILVVAACDCLPPPNAEKLQ